MFVERWCGRRGLHSVSVLALSHGNHTHVVVETTVCTLELWLSEASLIPSSPMGPDRHLLCGTPAVWMRDLYCAPAKRFSLCTPLPCLSVQVTELTVIRPGSHFTLPVTSEGDVITTPHRWGKRPQGVAQCLNTVSLDS